MKNKKRNLVVVAPDSVTTDYIASRLKGIKDLACEKFHIQKDWHKGAMGAVTASPAPVLLIALSKKMKRIPVELTTACSLQGGINLVWAAESPDLDTWLLRQLLLQNHSQIEHRLNVLLQAAALFIQTSPAGFKTVSVSGAGAKSELANRLSDRLLNEDKKKHPSLEIRIDAEGSIQAKSKAGATEIYADPRDLADACNLLCNHFNKEQASPSPKIQIDVPVVEMIARPPARVLSETTSKRLLGAFGMQFPRELLCDSPSSATRFAAGIGATVTLKLVRPEFTDKDNSGAVKKNLDSAPKVRKAYQSLLELGEKPGLPKPLGILVSEHIESESIFWIELARRKVLGSLVVLGSGNIKGEDRLAAVSTDASLDQITKVLARRVQGLTGKGLQALCLSTYRFCQAMEVLGGKITACEIHPLAVSPMDEVLALDALVAISE